MHQFFQSNVFLCFGCQIIRSLFHISISIYFIKDNHGRLSGSSQIGYCLIYNLNLPFLLSDTVGFIRKLPTDLVDSFKSTLDEVREADLLVHVVDISHPDFEEQIQIVDKTIADLGAAGKPTMIIFNKIDAYTYVEKAADDLTPKTKENITLEELMHTWMAKLNDNCIFISARNKVNIEALKDRLYKKVRELHVQKYPYNDFLYQSYDEEQ